MFLKILGTVDAYWPPQCSALLCFGSLTAVRCHECNVCSDDFRENLAAVMVHVILA